MTFPRHVTIPAVSESAITGPADLLEKLLSEPDFSSVAEIARTAGWNYQRLHRWSKGSVGADAIPQDDLADLLIDLERNPDDYGVRPSIVWKRKHIRASAIWAGDTDAVAAEAPPWFRQHVEQLDAQIKELHDKLDTLLNRPRGRQ